MYRHHRTNKNNTFPTDAKQYRKIHGELLKIARLKGIVLSRTYEKEVKTHKLHTKFATHPKNRKRAHKTVKRLMTISGQLLLEIQRKMTLEQQEYYAEKFALYQRMLNQKHGDKKVVPPA